MRDWVDGFGVAAPLVFIVVSASLTCALFPGPILAGASGLLFGTALGFPVALTAATLGASCAFLIARRVGLAAVEQLAGPRVRRIRDWIAPPRLRRRALRADRAGHAVRARQLRGRV